MQLNEDLIIDVEHGTAYMVNRPSKCPKVIIHNYDNLDRELREWEILILDKKGRKCIESVWG